MVALSDLTFSIDLLAKASSTVLAIGNASKDRESLLGEFRSMKTVITEATRIMLSSPITLDAKNAINWYGSQSSELILKLQQEVDSYNQYSNSMIMTTIGNVLWVYKSREKTIAWKKQLFDLRAAIHLVLQLSQTQMEKQNKDLMEEVRRLLEDIKYRTEGIKTFPELHKIPPSVGYTTQNAIVLFDALGATHLLPVQLCDTWEIFDKTLKLLFDHREGRNFVYSGNYDVSSEVEGRAVTIPSTDWKTQLLPGMSLRMSIIIRRSVDNMDDGFRSMALQNQFQKLYGERQMDNDKCRWRSCPRCGYRDAKNHADDRITCSSCDSYFRFSQTQDEYITECRREIV